MEEVSSISRESVCEVCFILFYLKSDTINRKNKEKLEAKEALMYGANDMDAEVPTLWSRVRLSLCYMA